MSANDTDSNPSGPSGDFGYAPVVHAVVLCLALAGVWLGLSGYFTGLLLSLGVVSVVLCVFVAMRMDVIDHEGIPVQFRSRIVLYWLWLLKEIVKANIDVALKVLQPKPDISPTLLEVKLSQKSDVGQVVYANSITLTPGTVSVVLDDDLILVHALTREGAEDLSGGEMDRRVTAVER